jgi:zinc transporter ZupT
MFRRPTSDAAPAWALTLGVVALLVVALAALALLGARSLPGRTGPPIEGLAVERTVLSPGVMELTVRNTGPDPVQVAQVFVNDVYVDVTGATEPIGRLGSDTLRLAFPWQNGQPYLVSMLTSTGLVVDHEIPAAVPTPQGSGFVASMALLGTYVGIIPVLLGMLFLPVLRHTGPATVRVLLAVTVGLLAFLAVDGTVEGIALAERADAVFGGASLVILGAALAYLLLSGIDQWLHQRQHGDRDEIRRSGPRLALMIAIGIGLHNLGEGLAIGSAYTVGELALGTALVVGFALHNTTEGIAVVAPLSERRTPLLLLIGLGLVAGAPTVLGALLGASVNNAELSAFLLGIGVGAIVQVIVQLVPALRRQPDGRLEPATVGGITAGIAVMYLTGLLVAA